MQTTNIMTIRLNFRSLILSPVCSKTIRFALLGSCLLLPVSAALAVQPPANLESDVPTSLNVGDPVGTFRVIKIAGCGDDGVEVGTTLCYRCRYGSSPMVLAFVRKASKQTDNLIQSLDDAIRTHQEKKLRGLVVLLGDDTATLETQAEQLAGRTKVQNIPIVISVDGEAGPEAYRLSMANEISIVIAKDSQVVATEFSSAGQVQSDAILNHIETMLTP